MTSAIDQKTAAILAAFNSKPYKNEVVRYDAPQALTDVQKAQARENIGVPTRSIGEIITSTLPLTDAGLHLLDGSVIQGNGIYSDFVTYIAGLDQNANYFCTESEWQASVSQYGVCGKFVYDSTANTVRLPKITGIVEGTTDLTALGDLVEAGLPNITGTAGIQGVSMCGFSTESYSGAFTSSRTGEYSLSHDGTSPTTGNLSLNASRSSAIYGNSSTVQPQTIKTLVYIVVATATKTDIEVDINNIVTDLNNKVDITSPQYFPVPNSAAAHNCFFRGADLSQKYTISELSALVRAGDFMDIFVGDYYPMNVTIDGTAYSMTFRVADLDYFVHNGDTETTSHHIVFVPDQVIMTNQKIMNDSNVTTGGFAGSKAWTSIIPKITTGLQNAFGTSHVLSHRRLLSNAVNTSTASMAGADFTGATYGWAWADAYACFLNEVMVYGCTVFSSSFHDVADGNHQFALFRLDKEYVSKPRVGWWLSAVASSTYFARVNDLGYAGYGSASDAESWLGVRPYFLFA